MLWLALSPTHIDYILKKTQQNKVREPYRLQEKNLYSNHRTQGLKITFSEYSDYLMMEIQELASIVSCNPI